MFCSGLKILNSEIELEAMKIQIKSRNGIKFLDLKLTTTESSKYLVLVDNGEIGKVWKADGRIKKTRNHRLDGTKTVDRWFAENKEGQKLGRKFPYDEGFSTRHEALTELIEDVLKVKRDWR